VRQSHKTILLWGVLILMFYLIYSIVSTSRAEVQDVNFSEFVTAVDSGALKGTEIEIRNDSEFTWVEGKTHKKSTGKFSDDVMGRMITHGIKFRIVSEESGAFLQSLLLSWLPMLLVFLFLFFLMRQLQTGGGKAMSFGKAKARLVSEGSPKITFKDVAGIEEAKEELAEIIAFLRDPKKFTRLGGRIPKGVLLMGPPGTGKTLLARAIAGEAGVPFFSISGSDFVEMFVGVGASRVRDLFEQSKKHAPCIVFIDEIDAVGRHRGAGLGGGHDEREQTLNQLLVEMDGFESNEGVILIAATNRPDVLDPALLRPGRFDRRVVVPRPDLGGRGEILKVHTKKVPLDENVDLEIIARGTPGFSGADLANLVNEAALIAARDNKNKVAQHDFEHAKDKVLMGAERKSMVISEQEKLTTAYHEAGHTMIAKMLPNADPVHKVTIIPRGRALGLTQQLPLEDRYNLSRGYALDRIAILFGGRIAEDAVFKEITTGAGNDLEVATDTARKMVCEWGMSDKLGPITFGKKEEAIFLGREIAQHQEYSEQTALEIDAEVRRIVSEQYERAKQIILGHMPALKRLADALIEYETIEGDEVQLLIEGKPLLREPPKIRMSTREDREKKYQAEKDRKKASAQVIGTLVGDPSKA